MTDDSRGYLLDVGDRRVLFLTRESFAGRSSDGIDFDDMPGPPSAFRMSRYADSKAGPAYVMASGPPLPRGRAVVCLPLKLKLHFIGRNGTLFENVSLATIEAELPTLFGNEFDGFLPEGD